MSLLQFGFTTSKKRNSDPKNTVDLTNSDTDSAKKTKATGSEQGSYEKDRVRVFLPTWKKNREWLKYIEEENIMVCSLCKKYKKTESDFVKGCSSFRLTNIKKHE